MARLGIPTDRRATSGYRVRIGSLCVSLLALMCGVSIVGAQTRTTPKAGDVRAGERVGRIESRLNQRINQRVGTRLATRTDYRNRPTPVLPIKPLETQLKVDTALPNPK